MAEAIGTAIVDWALAAFAAEGSTILVVGEFLVSNAAIINAVGTLAVQRAGQFGQAQGA